MFGFSSFADTSLAAVEEIYAAGAVAANLTATLTETNTSTANLGVGKILSGNATETNTSTADLNIPANNVANLTATLTETNTSSASLGVGKLLSSNATETNTSTASLSVGKILAANASETVTTTASIIKGAALTANTTETVTATANLSSLTFATFAATLTEAVTSTASLSVGNLLAGNTTETNTTTAILGAGGKPLFGNCSEVTTTTASLSTGQILAGNTSINITTRAEMNNGLENNTNLEAHLTEQCSVYVRDDIVRFRISNKTTAVLDSARPFIDDICSKQTLFYDLQVGLRHDLLRINGCEGVEVITAHSDHISRPKGNYIVMTHLYDKALTQMLFTGNSASCWYNTKIQLDFFGKGKAHEMALKTLIYLLSELQDTLKTKAISCSEIRQHTLIDDNASFDERYSFDVTIKHKYIVSYEAGLFDTINHEVIGIQ